MSTHTKSGWCILVVFSGFGRFSAADQIPLDMPADALYATGKESVYYNSVGEILADGWEPMSILDDPYGPGMVKYIFKKNVPYTPVG